MQGKEAKEGICTIGGLKEHGAYTWVDKDFCFISDFFIL